MRKLLTAVATACVLASGSLASHATVLPYKNFDKLVAEADGVVVGTVQSVESRFVGHSKRIVTLVTLGDLDVMGAKYRKPTLTLRLEGGLVGNEGMHVEGSPDFATNERVLLFVQGNGRDLVPFVGWNQGVFRLRDNGGETQVLDADGNVVTGIDAGRVMRAGGAELDVHIVGGPVRNERSSAAESHGGESDDGSAVIQVEPAAAMAAPMTASDLMKQIRARAGSHKAGKLQSFDRAELDRAVTADTTEDVAGADDAKAAAVQKIDRAANGPVLPQRSQQPAASDAE